MLFRSETPMTPHSQWALDAGPSARGHQHAAIPLWRYLHRARLLVLLSAPLIYACLLPLLLLDLFVSIYQAVCFPIYSIPKVRRSQYLVFDRAKLHYLNAAERINCLYCSYANGLMAYCVEIAARTEQHWCPIKHAQELRAAHSRYARFLPHGDASAWREDGEAVRSNFRDL
jgi:hypothetical protein